MRRVLQWSLLISLSVLDVRAKHSRHRRTAHEGPLARPDEAVSVTTTAAPDHHLSRVTPREIAGSEEVVKHVMSQYIGVLPPSIVSAARSGVAPIKPLKDSKATPDASPYLISAIESVSVLSSENFITATAHMNECLHRALEKQDLKLACYTSVDGPLEPFYVLFAGYIEQAAGYLPPNIVLVLSNALGYYLSLLSSVADLQELCGHISDVLASVTASTSGTVVTCLNQLQICIFNAVRSAGDEDLKTKLSTCIGSSLMTNQQILLNSCIQQGFGYLPPNLVSDLQKAS